MALCPLCPGISAISLGPSPNSPPAPGLLPHLQLQHFLLLELRPEPRLLGLAGLLLRLALLLLQRLLPQPR